MSAWLGSRDPQPRSRDGEVAFLVLSGVLFMLGVGALTCLGAASSLFGGSGWVWPDGSDTIGRTLGGLLTGHPGAGLPPQLQARVPGPAVVYRCVAVTELAALIVSVTAGVVWWRYRRRPMTPAGAWPPEQRPPGSWAGPGCGRHAGSFAPTCTA